MPTVKLTGVVNIEFEVKYGLAEDLMVNVQAIEFTVNEKPYKVLVGEGDICHISEKTLDFIGNRILNFLKEDKTVITVSLSGSYPGFHKPNRKFAVSGDEEAKIYNSIMNTDLGKIMLKTYGYEDGRLDFAALKEVVERNIWFVSISGMKEFCRLKNWYASKSHLIEKYINK